LNTQTHVLLALAALVSSVPASVDRPRPAVQRPPWQRARRWLLAGAILGALAPDATLFLMVGMGKLQGVPDAVIFGLWYRLPLWQGLATVSNSVPLYLAVLAMAWTVRHRWPRAAAFTLVFALAALLHALTDLPLHHDDGRPHFWPFSDWVFVSPVSYWDPAHHGRIWSVIELALAAATIVICWRALRHRAWRIVLILLGASYAGMAAYWWQAFA